MKKRSNTKESGIDWNAFWKRFKKEINNSVKEMKKTWLF